MERDFMGLNSKDTLLKKEAVVAGCNEAYGFKAFNNHHEGKFQGAHFLQLEYNDARQAVLPSSSSNCLFRPQFSGAAVQPHLLGVPVASYPAVSPFPDSFFTRKTQPPWYSSKVDSGPAQLTILYGGLVNVYNDISPKKAQAIMLMAGNGTFLSAGTTPKPKAQAHGHTPMTPARDEAYYLSQPASAQPCSAASSPVSVSSHPVGEASGGPTDKSEEAKILLSSLGQAIQRQSVFPQARKASLARFLEKRKERGLASAPYSLTKQEQR